MQISATVGSGDQNAIAQATADGLRYALVIIAFTFAWSTYHYFRANRTLREEEEK